MTKLTLVNGFQESAEHAVSMHVQGLGSSVADLCRSDLGLVSQELSYLKLYYYQLGTLIARLEGRL